MICVPTMFTMVTHEDDDEMMMMIMMMMVWRSKEHMMAISLHIR